jgi:prepilin-type N-terminal cleavage/methylation domain-containing protein
MRKKRGYTLIEVLFAIFMVLICAMIVAATMPISNVSNAKASDLQKAIDLSQKELELIQQQGFNNCNASQLAAAGLIDNTTAVYSQGHVSTYTCNNVGSTVNDSPAQVLTNGTGTVTLTTVNIGLTQVVVTIKWRDRMQYKTYSVGTLIANL